jgi:hypothetical protein
LVARALRPWQSGLAAIVGFTGVILTIHFQAESSRELEETKRDSAAQALRVSLAVEMNSLVRSFCATLNDAAGERTSGIIVLVHNPEVFRSRMPELGLVTALEAVRLTEFHADRDLTFAALTPVITARVERAFVVVPRAESPSIKESFTRLAAGAERALSALVDNLPSAAKRDLLRSLARSPSSASTAAELCAGRGR